MKTMFPSTKSRFGKGLRSCLAILFSLLILFSTSNVDGLAHQVYTEQAAREGASRNEDSVDNFTGDYPVNNQIQSPPYILFLPLIMNGYLPPSAFNKHAPANGSTGVSLSPVLSWNVSANATKYEYCYDTSNDGTCSNWISTGTNTYVGLSGLQQGTTYYWQVRAWNGTYGPTYANGSASAYWSFTTVIMVPGAFNKHAPANGSTGVSLSPVLSWNVSANATRYEYCYDTTNDGACGTWTSTGTNNYAGLWNLQPATTYYWQTRAWNGAYGPTYANGSASAYWSFTTAVMVPGVFNKNAPASGTTGVSLSPILSWNISANTTKYEYCYDTANDGNCSSWISTGTNNYAGLRGLEPETTYYWQVRSWNGTYGPTYANGSASAYWSFTTAIMLPGAFNKHAPANGTTRATLSPILSWNVSSNATEYEYCFDTTNDGNCSSWISTGTNNYAGLRDLEPATTYYWQVRSWNGTYGPTYANGSANAYWSLTTLASDVWIMDNCSFTENRTGTYQYITCEMYNNTLVSIKSVKLYVDLYDSDGTLIGTDFAYTLLDLVHPQEIACVRISFPAMTNLSHYSLYRSYSIAANELRPPLAISNHSGSAEPYGYEVLGIITNNSQVTLEKVSAVDTLYDSGGLVIGCDYAYINQDPANLAPGQQSSFRIYTLMKDPYLIARYKLQADGSILTTDSSD